MVSTGGSISVSAKGEARYGLYEVDKKIKFLSKTNEIIWFNTLLFCCFF